MTDKQYRPSGSMCLVCDKGSKDCSALPFKDMREMKSDPDGVIVVVCDHYQRIAKTNNQHKDR